MPDAASDAVPEPVSVVAESEVQTSNEKRPVPILFITDTTLLGLTILLTGFCMANAFFAFRETRSMSTGTSKERHYNLQEEQESSLPRPENTMSESHTAHRMPSVSA